MTIQEIKNRLNVFNFSERQKYILAKIIKDNSFENVEEQDIFQIVQTLPDENINENKIYIVSNKNGKEDNVYIEYIYIDGNWEIIGKYTANIDLSKYIQYYDIGTINQGSSVNYSSLLQAVQNGKIIIGTYNNNKVIFNASIGTSRINLLYFEYDDSVNSNTKQWSFYVDSTNTLTITGSWEIANNSDIPQTGINNNTLVLTSDTFTYGTTNNCSITPESSVIVNAFWDINGLNAYYNCVANILKISINGTILNLTVSSRLKTNTSKDITEFKFICYDEYYRIIVDIKYTTSTTKFTPTITFDKINFLTD